MTIPNDTPADATTQPTENAEDKSLAFSSMEDKTVDAESVVDKQEQADKEDIVPDENGDVEVDYKQIKAPDGFTLDEDVMGQVSPILKELNCSKENAEKIIAAGSDIYKRAIEGQAQAFAKKVEDWGREVKADEVLGKDENIAIANRAIKEFGDERLSNEIIKAGLGNHPAFVRFCYSVGKAICEDQVVSATGSAKASNRNEIGEPMLEFKGM